LTGTASSPFSGGRSLDAGADCDNWFFRFCCRLLLSEGRPGVVGSGSAMDSFGSLVIAELLLGLLISAVFATTVALTVTLHDLTGEAELVNVPATTDECTHWRRRISVILEDVSNTIYGRRWNAG
jgi:hypothetical protein